jgi:hypothetical protein
VGEHLSWNYPVHYFDYLPPLADQCAEDPERLDGVCALVRRWIEAHPPGTEVAWDPYPTALRIVNWLDVVHTLGARADPGWRGQVLGSVYQQAAWLRRRLERHLLGTHLLKDAKAMLVAAATFSDGASVSWRREAQALLAREIDAQIGPEGAHLEPSLMYHCTALEDLLDLLNFEGVAEGPLRESLTAASGRMLRFAGAVQTPAGGFPLLGDAWEGGAPTPKELGACARRLGLPPPAAENGAGEPSPSGGMRLFGNAGILVWRGRRCYFVADVGGIGPPHLSGHGHCDSLSFECWIDGLPFVVDSGTWSYEPGEFRHGCRATRAHNTLELDGREQHEIWAAFRVARRSKVRAVRLSVSAVEAALVPWHDRRTSVRRRFEFDAAAVAVHDRVEGPGRHRVVSRLHLHPDCEVSLAPDRALLRRGGVRVEIVWEAAAAAPQPGPAPPAAPPAPAARLELLPAPASGSLYAERAGETRPNAVLQIVHEGQLPFGTVLRIRPLGRN